ncbi:uncharacterized protein LOC134694278 [Mytilus trossulus]|uniref:uncharacterized protein LOC134694278 n=1 Tax=Mytilus trossulus TaxID=6551 RepID=UPI0030070C4B
MADSKFCAGCQLSDEDITAVSWCSDCCELVCKACSRVHKIMSPPHKVIQIKEIQQLNSSLLSLSKNCDNHPDQKIAVYCCQHDKVVCVSCVPVSHQNCKSIISIEIHVAARGVKDGTAISDLERRISNLCQVTENRRCQSERTLVDLEESRTKIKTRVSEIKRKVIAYLDTLEAEIHKDLDSKYKSCTESVSLNRNSIQSSSDSLSSWKHDLNSLKQHTSEAHLFQVVKFLDAKIYQKELEIREVKAANVPILTFNPSVSASKIKKLVPDLGKITVENVQVPKPVQISTNNVIFPEKQLFVCKLDGSNSNVIDLDYKPHNISSYDIKHDVVSAGDASIQIIDLTSLTPGRTIKVEGNCYGITIVKDTIWVKHKPYTLTIVDINGKVLKVIHTTFDRREIYANQDGDVYCTDLNSNTIFLVSADGKEREIYNSPDMKGAIGVAVDDRGDVYVAGCISNNIHRISNDGQKHDIVLTADDGIDLPSGISYNNESKELLVTHYGESVNIYKTQMNTG